MGDKEFLWIISGTIAGFFLLFAIICAASLIRDHFVNRGDYKDGGGKQIGGQDMPFFASANDSAGIKGEIKTNYYLRPLLRNDEYLLANLLIPLKNGWKTEIDCILISRKGVFCIETKRWVGHISGDDKDEYWIQQYDDPCKSDREHPNPVRQNEDHCQLIERILRNKYEVINAVVFADLEDGLNIDSDYVYTIDGFKYCYRSMVERVSIEEVENIYQTLVKYVASEEELKQFKKDIQRRNEA